MSGETEKPRRVVRDAELSDADAIGRLHVRSWQSAYRGMMPDSLLDNLSIPDRVAKWNRRLMEGAESTLIVEEAGTIAGWATFGEARDEDTDKETGELSAIYLDPDYWNRGLGTLLYQEAEKRLRESGYSKIIVWVLEANARARGFYEFIGYSLDGVTKAVKREGAQEPERHLRYRKNLQDKT